MDLVRAERTIGGSGLSIGTHLAMENIFKIPRYDPDVELANPFDVNEYKYYFFNFYTLVRNVANSYTERDKMKIYQSKDLYNMVETEVDLLLSYFHGYKCQLVFYKLDYTKPIKEMNKNKGEKITNKEIEYDLLTKVIKSMLNNKERRLCKMIENIKSYKLPNFEGNGIIMTHYCIDLLNNGKITLMESHTGKLKTRWAWYTRFHKLGDKDLANIPFTECNVCIFGDRSLTKIIGLLDRRAVYALSKEKNWTYRTSSEKVKYDIRNNPTTRHIAEHFTNLY